MSPKSPLRKARGAILGTRSRVLRFLNEFGRVVIPPSYKGFRWSSAVILLLLFVQLITGVLLSLYYRPEPAAAHESMRFLVSSVPSGWLVRGMHHWAGDLLLVTVALHMTLVFMRRAYARPREFQWVVGVGLLLVVLAMRFTGSLLPWDGEGYAGALLGLKLVESVPLLGGLLAVWLRAGEVVGPDTLNRFFTTHALLLPWILLALFGLHAVLISRHGLSEDEP